MSKFNVWAVSVLLLVSVASYSLFADDDYEDLPLNKSTTTQRHYGPSRPWMQPSLVPSIGTSWYTGRWSSHIGSSYSFGLGFDIPLSASFSTEIEAAYSRNNIKYSTLPVSGMPSLLINHGFDQYSIGANAKYYFLTWSAFRPYVGGGLMALHYSGMQRTPWDQYSQTIGAAQALLGMDVRVSDGIAVGLRGTYVLPVFNRPLVLDNGVFAYPGYEEASAMNASFVRVSGSVKVSL